MTSLFSDQIEFSSGVLIGFRTDTSGVTPVQFGILQDVALDHTIDLKTLHGQGRYPVATAPGKHTIELKARFAGIRGRLFNDLYFGETTAATQTKFADGEAAAVPATTPFTVTVANAANFLLDQGVFYDATGAALSRVTTPASAGEYAVNETTGVYTFASADASAVNIISYTYSSVTGIQIPITQKKMGAGPIFRITLAKEFDGRQGNYIFNACRASKLSLPGPQGDFEIAELDFAAFADAAGNVGSLNFDL